MTAQETCECEHTEDCPGRWEVVDDEYAVEGYVNCVGECRDLVSSQEDES